MPFASATGRWLSAFVSRMDNSALTNEAAAQLAEKGENRQKQREEKEKKRIKEKGKEKK